MSFSPKFKFPNDSPSTPSFPLFDKQAASCTQGVNVSNYSVVASPTNMTSCVGSHVPSQKKLYASGSCTASARWLVACVGGGMTAAYRGEDST